MFPPRSCAICWSDLQKLQDTITISRLSIVCRNLGSCSISSEILMLQLAPPRSPVSGSTSVGLYLITVAFAGRYDDSDHHPS